MRTIVPAAVAAACVALSACGLPTVDKEADAKARALFEQIRTGADLAANPDLAPDLRTPAALAQLAAVKQALPDGAPTATAVRSWNVKVGSGGTTAALVHAYSYPARTVLTETVLLKDGSKTWKVAGFHVKIEDPSAKSAPTPAPAVTVETTRDI